MIKEINMVKSLPEILARIEKGEAVVMTSQEVCDLVRTGEQADLQDVDVVTTATRAVMSGTYALFSFPVADPGSFSRAAKVWLNGISAHVGPCPNEKLGVVDLMVFGTAHSRNRRNYGGGHLFRDLVERKPVIVEVETDEGKTLQVDISLDQMPHARLYGTRHAFKNYYAFVNPGDSPVSTIFHARPFEPHFGGATFSGCGQINPVKNDPLLESIGVGTRVLINGAEGFVMAQGTRSNPQRPNLTGFADMHEMDPKYMGGFITSAGPECICSLAVPIPVTTDTILKEIARLDRDIPLPVMDVNARCFMGQANYGDVWDSVDLYVEFDSQRCSECARCLVEEFCPMEAVIFDGTNTSRDESRCFHCGLCVSKCPAGAFRCNLGSIRLHNITIPVVLRQSDRFRALMLARDLKRKILDGSFRVTQPIEKIH
jgi:putative methanogenesis marker 16 metalloprotein